MVDIGGYELRLRCSGKGSPTVVFDAGLGDSLEQWDRVRRGAAGFTRACAYDRAGLGGSDTSPQPRVSSRIAIELERLLSAAGESGPFVLVGHSFGGLNVRMFSVLFPEEVAGVLLVDATHELYERLSLRAMTGEELVRQQSWVRLLPLAAQGELEALPRSSVEVARSGWVASVPTIVLTGAERPERPELARLWLQLQRELGARPGVVEHVVAQDSGHRLQHDKPELILESIRRLVELAFE
jgi:pimeloyl-ACP methyl ester carboxylesterase